MTEPCEACKTIPPVVHEGYERKGEIKEYGGLNCYVSHPTPLPQTGVLIIYDIFGLPFDQTAQGADIVALTEPGHLVIVPDFFKGEPLDISNYPPDTKEKQQKVNEFFTTKADIAKTIAAATKVIEDVKAKFPDVKKWGVFGYCWGGKVATLLAKETDHFSASVQVHPAFLDAKDIEDKPDIPHLLLASKDEPPEAVKAYQESIHKRGDKHSKLHVFNDSIHGWMAARANLSKAEEKKHYEEGYKHVVKFFKDTLYSLVNDRVGI